MDVLPKVEANRPTDVETAHDLEMSTLTVHKLARKGALPARTIGRQGSSMRPISTCGLHSTNHLPGTSAADSFRYPHTPRHRCANPYCAIARLYGLVLCDTKSLTCAREDYAESCATGYEFANTVPKMI